MLSQLINWIGNHPGVLRKICGQGWVASSARWMGLQRDVMVRSFDVRLPRIHGKVSPLRIAFASDFHAGPTTHFSVLEAAFTQLRRLAPDVLLLGGDFVEWEARCIDRLAARLENLPAPWGRFAVLGNHDYRAGADAIRSSLEAHGIRVLINGNIRLQAPFSDIWICGLDDAIAGRPNAQLALAGADGIRVVLMHQPDGLYALRQEDFAIAFCGHTHGGQVALPNGRPVVFPQGQLSRFYSAGRYQLGEQTLIVSRGVGCSTLPMRLFAPPDICLCQLAGALNESLRSE